MTRVELLERIEAHIRGHELIPPGGEITCLVSGGADSTCLWHALGALGYRVSALHVNHGLRGDESDARRRVLPRDLRRRGRRRASRAHRGGAPRGALLVRDRPPARDRPHRFGPGRDDPVPARRQRFDPRDQAAPRGRRRAPAAHALARGDRGLLPRQRARVSERFLEPGHPAWPHPGRAAAAHAAAASGC